ncbi:antibiotic biosynthesis monooxygenase (plasmid) [Photobacterium sp. GJ3]|uniref:putative quinol monooxygenase n=1 Tax=Photobacterium sp. GJ3 TaxID=2829502 RepID=UPI001B8B0B64|nr:putative quinol monooxygenase [Photobacterium sp. GJ3]QUJ70438.1 antibiotic biosynthesis monooxygenase [Photobacterium sp. GJ3]
MSSKITVVATLVAKENKTEILKNALSALIVPSREEDGCIRYDLHQSIENPAKFTVLEEYQNQSALDYHNSQPYLSHLINQLDTLAENVDIATYLTIS